MVNREDGFEFPNDDEYEGTDWWTFWMGVSVGLVFGLLFGAAAMALFV